MVLEVGGSIPLAHPASQPMEFARLGPIGPIWAALAASIRSAAAAASHSIHPGLKQPETDFQPTISVHIYPINSCYS